MLGYHVAFWYHVGDDYSSITDDFFYMYKLVMISDGDDMALSGSVTPDQTANSKQQDEIDPKQGINGSSKQHNTWTEVGE